MDTKELIEILERREDTKHQFRENFTNIDAIASEIVAFSNVLGGQIFIGVRNDGSVVGLNGPDIDRLNQMISNAASQSVRPAVNPITENVPHPNGTVMVVTIAPGANRPYMDKNGTIWVKSGSDKRRATSREEIQRLFQQSGILHADETPVQMLGVDDVDWNFFKSFLESRFGKLPNAQKPDLPKFLRNMNLMVGDRLNLAGALLFAEDPRYALPAFGIKAVAFYGTSVAETTYIDSREIGGRLTNMFRDAMSFLSANLRAVQAGQGFNSIGKPEIPLVVWEELLVNALVHRDYFVSAPIRILIFEDRVEIISPGHLPNNLTIENIKAGNSNMRNPILSSFASWLLPYRGLGTGVIRAYEAWPEIELIDDRESNLFKAIVKRPPPPTRERLTRKP